jgi:hypothetical protein
VAVAYVNNGTWWNAEIGCGIVLAFRYILMLTLRYGKILTEKLF